MEKYRDGAHGGLLPGNLQQFTLGNTRQKGAPHLQ